MKDKIMHYYIFKPATNTSETGFVFPQVQKMKPGYNYKAFNSIHALSRAVQHIPDFIPDLDFFVVSGKAKLTDLLSVSVVHGGFLISPQLKNILEKFYFPPHKFYAAKVFYKKQMFDYFWVHIVCDFSEQVDYRNSKFFIYYNYAHNLGYKTILSAEDYLNQKEIIKKYNPDKTITIWAEQIKMSDNFDRRLDIFQVSTFDANYYISENLKNVIENKGIPGCLIQEAKNLII